MIRHIVFFSARNGEDRHAIRDLLRGLGDIPHVARFEVAENMKVDPLSDDIDIVVYAEFAGPEDLAAYRAHPIYGEVTRKVRPLRELRYSADIPVET